MNCAYVEACRTQGIDPANPLGATAEIDNYRQLKKASTKKEMSCRGKAMHALGECNCYSSHLISSCCSKGA
jgi:hypothetical protein